MKLFKATIAVIGISLCLAGCKKMNAHNAAQDNSTMNAATAPASMNATDMNATDMNSTNMNATGNGTKTDPGTRG